jgi:hypothetical protein
MDASYVDLADPAHLEFDYLRWIRLVLRAYRARRVLHVGGGACALPRALAAADPRGRQEVCEVDPEVLGLAREHLGLRRSPGLRVREAEGRAFVARQADSSWDAVVLDAFVGAAVPPRLITAEALRDLARVAPLALVNVVDNRGASVVRRVAAGLAAACASVWGLTARGGNTVVVGTRGRPDLERIAAQAAADPSPARLIDPGSMTRLIGGTSPRRDEEIGGLAASCQGWSSTPARAIRARCSPARRRAGSARPGAHAADPLDGDVGDEPGRRIVHRRKFHVRPEIGAGETLEQLGGAALGDAGAAVDHQVLRQAHLVVRAGFDRQRHPWVAADVAELPVLGQVARDELVAVEPDPHDRYLRTSVRFERDQVGESRALQHRAGRVGNRHDRETLPPQQCRQARQKPR